MKNEQVVNLKLSCNWFFSLESWVIRMFENVQLSTYLSFP